MKVKGYYNTINGIFLGPMTALNEATGVASTPRYIEGVCFGEFDTLTGIFVPETNPMIIPRGQIYTQDEVLQNDGTMRLVRTGIEEDRGADFARKKIVSGIGTGKSTSVYTGDENAKEIFTKTLKPIQKPKVTVGVPIAPKKRVAKPAGRMFDKSELPKNINWDKIV